MMNIFVIVVVLLKFLTSYSLIYPCEQNFNNENRIHCDLCRCLALRMTKNFSSNLCSSLKRFDCREQFERFDEKPNDFQLELNSFDDHALEIFDQKSEICLREKFLNIVFLNFNSVRFPTRFSSCLFDVKSLQIVNSRLADEFPMKTLKILRLLIDNSTLKTFDFDWNRIEFGELFYFNQSFFINSSLSLIDLTIRRSENFDLFGHFPHLSNLNLAETNLNDEKWKKILDRIQCPDLVRLILRANRLTMVHKNFPSTVRYLDLSFNEIKSLDYFSFKSLYSLNSLNLSWNYPLEIGQETFSRVPYLEILDLSSCSATFNADDLFVPLQKLHSLNISKNQLKTFPILPVPHDVHFLDNDGSNLPVLSVDASKNHLESLEIQQFFISSNVREKFFLKINVEENRLKTLKFGEKRRGPSIEFDFRRNPFECDCDFYRTVNDFSLKSNRIELIHLTNLTCVDLIDRTQIRSIAHLKSSTSFCSYEENCPKLCSCFRSADESVNRIDCSNRNLHEFPTDLPATTTHLDLSENFIEQLPLHFLALTHLKKLSLAKNRLKILRENQFSSLIDLEDLNLSSNQIERVSLTAFHHLYQLKRIDLQKNTWIPNFFNQPTLFETNLRLSSLIYADGLVCNRSMNNVQFSSTDCCRDEITNPSCQKSIQINSTEFPRIFSTKNTWNHEKNFQVSLFVIVPLIIFTLILLIVYRRKRLLLRKETFLVEQEANRKSNPYDHQISSSITDEDDDYASIPLTQSSNDLTKTKLVLPPLPPRFDFSLPFRSTPSIEIDVLVLYSIEDSLFVHENLSSTFENLYGNRFHFHFIHRDRTFAHLHWLLENSSVTLLILRPTRHVVREFSSKQNSFIILISNDETVPMTSLKLREKLARLYRTSNIYQWDPNPNALVHEQFEIFLELNCPSKSFDRVR